MIESGGNSEEVTPVPIPNTVVKLFSADDTRWETARESRTLPVSTEDRSLRRSVFFFFFVNVNLILYKKWKIILYNFQLFSGWLSRNARLSFSL